MASFRVPCILTAFATATAMLPAWSLSGEALQTKLEARFAGDRTGACVLAAVIEGDQVRRGKVCALPRTDGGPGFDSVFEIGSVSKTMTAFLVAELISRGLWSLDDPIAKHLPPGTAAPRQGERQITVRDLLAHTSGLPVLPPGFNPKNAADPYADLDEAAVLEALKLVTLDRPIGSQYAYSNFGMMVVSMAVARSLGGDLEDAMVKRLFEPLQMSRAFIATPRQPVLLAEGHLSTGRPTSAWHAPTNIAGFGMVRASLDDMVKYAQALLGRGPSTALHANLQLTQQPLREGTAMTWALLSFKGHDLVVHEGGTGGFSSLVALEPRAQKAVVILADASQSDLGGLGALGLSFLDIDVSNLRPRLAVVPSEALLAAVVGDYEMAGMNMRIWMEGKQLMAQADAQQSFALKYDSMGDFYPDSFDALFSPQVVAGRVVRAIWRQGGGSVEVLRKGQPNRTAAPDPRWKDFAGEYALMPQFSLRVFEEAGVLKVQGSGQPAIAAELTDIDTIEIRAVAAVVQFKRDAAGLVVSAVLKQNGQVFEGQRK